MKCLVLTVAILATAAHAAIAGPGDASVEALCHYQHEAQGIDLERCRSDNSAAELATLVMRERFPKLGRRIDDCIDQYTAAPVVNWVDVGRCVAER